MFGKDVRLEELLEAPGRWYCICAASPPPPGAPPGARDRVLGFAAAAVGRVSEFPQVRRGLLLPACPSSCVGALCPFRLPSVAGDIRKAVHHNPTRPSPRASLD